MYTCACVHTCMNRTERLIEGSACSSRHTACHLVKHDATLPCIVIPELLQSDGFVPTKDGLQLVETPFKIWHGEVAKFADPFFIGGDGVVLLMDGTKPFRVPHKSHQGSNGPMFDPERYHKSPVQPVAKKEGVLQQQVRIAFWIVHSNFGDVSHGNDPAHTQFVGKLMPNAESVVGERRNVGELGVTENFVLDGPLRLKTEGGGKGRNEVRNKGG